MDLFYAFLGKQDSRKIKLAVMDMWKPFRIFYAASRAQGFTKCRQVSHRQTYRRYVLDAIRKSK